MSMCGQNLSSAMLYCYPLIFDTTSVHRVSHPEGSNSLITAINLVSDSLTHMDHQEEAWLISSE